MSGSDLAYYDDVHSPLNEVAPRLADPSRDIAGLPPFMLALELFVVAILPFILTMLLFAVTVCRGNAYPR